MAKKVARVVKLQVPAGKATPAPPVGPALGQAGVNIMAFVKDYNARTQNRVGEVIPAEITVYTDGSFTFVLKTPPTTFLIKKAAGLEKGSGLASKGSEGTITRAQVREIAETKFNDTNAVNIEGAIKQIEGSARNMGIKIVD